MNEASSRIRVWDMPVRIFHWTLAGAFIGAYLLAETERQRQIHVMFGYTVLGLVAFRLIWGFVGTRYAHFGSFLYGPKRAFDYLLSLVQGSARRYAGHNPLGSWAVYGILLFAAATGITGYMTLNERGGEAFEELHGTLANGWLVLLVAHVAGVIVGSIAHRENLARAMITGYKRSAGGEASVPSRPLVGALLAVCIIGFWTFSLLGGGVSGTTAEQNLPYAQSAMEPEEEGDED